jgi:hypothetical protein
MMQLETTTMKFAFRFAAGMLLLASPVAAQQPATAFSVKTYSPTPMDVVVILNKSAEDNQERHQLSAGQGAWTISLPWSPQSKLEIRRGKLEASYAEPESGSYIPIRLTRLLTSVDLQIRKTAAPKCLEPNLQIIEKSGQADDHRFKAYLLARDLFYLGGQDACGSFNKDRVIKAWLERSYDLATNVDYVDLDPDAVDAAKARFGEAYAKPRVDQVKGYEVQLLQDRKLTAIRLRNYSGAISLQELIASMTSNDSVAKAVETHQGLTVKQIKDDGLYIETLARTAGVRG